MESENAPQPRRLLVLGTSGADGGGFADPSSAKLWPESVREKLSERLGPTALTLRRFYIHVGDPWGTLERELASQQWDFIVLKTTSWPATQKTVAHRVNRIMGKRLADWTEARVRTIDRRTRRRGRIRHAANRFGHRLARRLVGTAPMMGLQPLIDGYLRAIDRIAMVETASVAIIGTGFPSQAAVRNNQEVLAIKGRFDGAMAGAAKRKHLGWIDSAAVTRDSDDPEAQFLDMLHKGRDWHEGIAEHLAEELLRHWTDGGTSSATQSAVR